MNQYRRFFLPVALIVPLIGLGLIWLLTERESYQGTEWEVPIAGYDPRDLLRGHYVQFRYDWPAVVENDIPTWSGSTLGLCIIGTSPRIEKVEVHDSSRAIESAAALDCAATAKVNPWSEEGDDGLVRDRIYVAQQAARDLEKKLANRELQGMVRIRINNSGFITPLSLSFRPRSDGDGVGEVNQ
tara:strand:- start:5316 stop:5870 length:555 start_codon:yes stop_codon:yes gene_type:complete